MESMIPAEGVGDGLAIGRRTTPIWLLYRILLGSAFANIGASANVVMSHCVTAPELRSVGEAPTGGVGLRPYWLNVVLRFKFAEIQVLEALLPCRNE